MSERKLHMIGNAHLDPVWLWQWQEGFQEAKATFRSALDRLAEYDDFVFTSSSAAVYEWVEHNEQAMFAEIAQRVAEGRWVLCGGWWVQADCNMPSGESFARQALYGQRYFREKFGVTCTVGYNVDSFGHHAMLPQLLRKSGMDCYVFMRPGAHEKRLDANLFWWESDDGSRVLTYRIPFYTMYGTDVEPILVPHVRKLAETSSGDDMVFYGVGNHGGGPTKRNIELIRKLDAEGGGPRLAFSSPDRFFAAVRERPGIPVLRDELQMHAKGCYSAHSAVKRWNRKAEHLLVTAEKFAVVADRLTGQPYPRQLEAAWKNVLFNQFHDILPGSATEVVYDDARDYYGEANAIASRALNNALQSISWDVRIDAEEGMKPIVVFNPHSWAVKTNVELEFGHFGIEREYHIWKPTDVLVDEEGRLVPSQPVKSLATTEWRHRISFVAELPPLGYRTFRMLARDAETGAAPAQRSVEATDATLENDRFRLAFDAATGYIASLFDKRIGFEVFRGPAARPAVIEDLSNTWSHGVERYDKEIGAFAARRIRLIEHGPVKSVLRVESLYGDSKLTQDFALYRELDAIEVSVTVDWREQWKMLKLQFPVNVAAEGTTYEIPYGHIVRDNDGDEQVGLGWFDQSGAAEGRDFRYGLSIVNDGKYSFDANGPVMSMTVLRSPIYAHCLPGELDPDGCYSFMDQGIHRFVYWLLPHEGDWKEAGTARRAAELNRPPIAIIETYHGGALPQRASFIEVDRDNIAVSALKLAEDGDDLIVRCHETHRMATTATIRLPLWDRTISAQFAPCEIKTFRVPRDSGRPVAETDLLERIDASDEAAGAALGG